VNTPQMLPLNASALSPLAIGIPKGQGDTKKASSENPARGEIFRRGLELFLKKKRWCLISHLSPTTSRQDLAPDSRFTA